MGGQRYKGKGVQNAIRWGGHGAAAGARGRSPGRCSYATDPTKDPDHLVELYLEKQAYARGEMLKTVRSDALASPDADDALLMAVIDGRYDAGLVEGPSSPKKRPARDQPDAPVAEEAPLPLRISTGGRDAKRERSDVAVEPAAETDGGAGAGDAGADPSPPEPKKAKVVEEKAEQDGVGAAAAAAKAEAEAEAKAEAEAEAAKIEAEAAKAKAKAEEKERKRLQKLEQKREERRNEKPADKLVRYTGDLMSALAVDAVDPERAVKTLRKLNGLELTADDFQQEQVLACAKNVKKCRKFANEAVQSAAADVWATWKAKIAAE